jgi:hypothetical protein
VRVTDTAYVHIPLRSFPSLCSVNNQHLCQRFVITIVLHTDSTWCTVPMPTTSHFAFAPAPSDLAKWRDAQRSASKGIAVLSRDVRTAFPHPDDFLDGDPYGQNYDKMVDVFVGYDTMLASLAGGKRAPATTAVSEEMKRKSKGFQRAQYVNSYAQRAPIVQLGSYKYTGKKWVQTSGDNLRTIDLNSFLDEFEAVEASMQHPCVFMAAMNKDWGYLSAPVSRRVEQPSVGDRHEETSSLTSGIMQSKSHYFFHHSFFSSYFYYFYLCVCWCTLYDCIIRASSV